MTNDQIYRKFHDGDEESFSVLYESLRKPVFIICFRILRNFEEAEDLTHDTFFKLYSAKPDDVTDVRLYLFQMAHNLAVSRLRKESRELLTPDPHGRGSRCLPETDTKIYIEELLAGLPLEERTVFTLRVNGELSFREIAKIENKGLSGVYRAYRHAVQSLKKAVTDSGFA